MASPERTSPQFSLHWDKCQENLLISFEKLLNSENFVDVSLAVESEVIKCHKVVLSACSEYFEKILIDNPCQHPVVIMRGMTYWEVSSLVNFMYKGEVSVEEERLDTLLKAAEALQIRGLAVTGDRAEKDPLSVNDTVKKCDSVIRSKKMYSKSKSKKSKPNPEMLNDEVEIKHWSDDSLGLFTKDNKSDSCVSVSSLDIIRPSGSSQKDEKPETELEKKTEEAFTTSPLPLKNVMIKEEVHMEFVNTDDVDNSIDYENFEDDDVSLDGNLMQQQTPEPGPSHHFLNVDSACKGINTEVVTIQNDVETKFIPDLGIDLLQKEWSKTQNIPGLLEKRPAKVSMLVDPQPGPQKPYGRCRLCPSKKNRKSKYYCRRCRKFFCLECIFVLEKILCRECEVTVRI